MKKAGLIIFVMVLLLTLYTWKVYGSTSYYNSGVGKALDYLFKGVGGVWNFFFTPKVVAVEVMANG